jgi:SAM-dependent methyltransferase
MVKGEVKARLKNILKKKDSAGEAANQRDSASSKRTSNAGPPARTVSKAAPKKESLKDKLNSSKFRMLNESLYTNDSSTSYERFKKDKSLYEIYHKGFSNQVSKWRLNPVDYIISKLEHERGPVADMGCGEAKIAKTFGDTKKVYSFDLYESDLITQCDIKNTPLKDGECNVVVFCLSLMGTNFNDFLIEGHRILAIGGKMFVAEVASRVDVKQFISSVSQLGFQLLEKRDEQYFVLFEFLKKSNKRNQKELPTLKPCLYKKR